MDTRDCPNCGKLIPAGHKFCGFCGQSVPEPMATPSDDALKITGSGQAKLILIRGEGLDGVTYQLNSTEHITGREKGSITFPSDEFVSPEHANFIYKKKSLIVKNLNSHNGVFFRITEPQEIMDGDIFICGEQVLKFEIPKPIKPIIEPEGTYFYGSPLAQWLIKVIQILSKGRPGVVYTTRKRIVTIGREDCDLNFPTDRYISRYHTKLEMKQGKYYLSDLDSRNGSYLQIRDERVLKDGDFIFVGKQLLRVEMNP